MVHKSSLPDLRGLSILFVSVASNAVGFGHLNRCIALARYASKCGASVEFLVFGDVAAESRVLNATFRCILRRESASETENWPDALDLHADAVIVDLLYPGFTACDASQFVFKGLRRYGRLLVVIDVLGEDSIICQSHHFDADIVISPYVSVAIDTSEAGWLYLKGPRFALLGVEYANLPSRRVRRSANRVLVSCGGSDPKGHTAKVLSGLGAVTRALEIRTIVGPMFSHDLRCEVERMAASSHHKVTIVPSPPTLLADMLWCDVAVGANGLTKYELAASGTPSLLFSIDERHDLANRPFAAMETSIDLGIGVAQAQVAHEANQLLDNYTLRYEMAKKASALVDGAGAKRLFSAVKKLSPRRTN